MESAKYLALEYGKIRNPSCNVHKSQGTLPATRLHYHDFYQIYFLIKGSLTHYAEGGERVLHSGDCFILPPNVAHRIERGDPDTLFYSFSFRREFLPEGIPSCLAEGNSRLRLTPDGPSLSRLERLLRCALEEFEDQQPGWEDALRGLLTAILVLLSRTDDTQASTGRETEVMNTCIQYIQENLGGPLELAALQQKYHLSASTFYRAFHRRTGESFQNYVLQRRVERACSLLRQTKLPLSQVAQQCGFGNYSGFYRAFRDRTGLSPREYRNYGMTHR